MECSNASYCKYPLHIVLVVMQIVMKSVNKRICIHVSLKMFRFSALTLLWGTGIRGLMRGMATLPQGNQELLVTYLSL